MNIGALQRGARNPEPVELGSRPRFSILNSHRDPPQRLIQLLERVDHEEHVLEMIDLRIEIVVGNRRRDSREKKSAAGKKPLTATASQPVLI